MAETGKSAEPEVDAERLKRAEAFVEQDEGATNRFKGWLGQFMLWLAVAMSLVHLYAAVGIVSPQTLRPLHVGFTLALCFLLYPVAKRFRHRLMPWDIVLSLASIVVIAYLLAGGDDITDRNTTPTPLDMAMGVALIVLILEACRRSTGIVMPIVVGLFLVYALLGKSLPAPWTHAEGDVGRLTGFMYQTLEGIFGTAVDVSSTLIILFTIYGAVLQVSGAGKFFIDFSFSAMGGRSSGAGPTIVLASFLLGGPSGSGVATTVTLGTVAYPMLARCGYAKNAAGGLLAAGGLGAIISPPVLGAAAFLIAEFLKISYFDVILMATIPTCLFYFSLLAMVLIDARKYGMRDIPMPPREKLGRLVAQSGFHFLSLVAIIVFMVLGATPMAAVFWATMAAIAVSALSRRDALVEPRTMLAFVVLFVAAWVIARFAYKTDADDVAFLVLIAALAINAWQNRRPGQTPRLVKALADGAVQMINVAATCAAAGIIVGVVGLTGLGLKFSSIVIDYAGGSVILTALYTALIVWIVGLAVPVTASYIICAVIAAPALIKLGVPDFAAHMFIFYYAVLSEVSPPTALSPFAAAAITGGGPYKTTLQAWKYTMPAFVVPFVFVLEPLGVGVLLKLPKGANWWEVAGIVFLTAAGIVALAAAFQGWFRRRMTVLEAAAWTLAGAMLVVPRIAAAILKPILTAAPLHLALAGLGLAVLLGLWNALRPATAR